MFKKNLVLSRSLEDYLEAIYNHSIDSNGARAKDVARDMGVSMPSVTGAVRSLASKGLVEHKPYESIALTSAGYLRAKGIADRHIAVKDFLVSVLGLDPKDAETEACGLEHAIQEDTLERLVRFVKECTDEECTCLNKTVDKDNLSCVSSPDEVVTLDCLCPGTRGEVLSVRGRGCYRKRLMEMGMSPGAEFEVLRVAPLGDPVELRLRGYLMSLRRNEAALVSVKVVENLD